MEVSFQILSKVYSQTHTYIIICKTDFCNLEYNLDCDSFNVEDLKKFIEQVISGKNSKFIEKNGSITYKDDSKYVTIKSKNMKFVFTVCHDFIRILKEIVVNCNNK
jgi:hypothetical protein